MPIRINNPNYYAHEERLVPFDPLGSTMDKQDKEMKAMRLLIMR